MTSADGGDRLRVPLVDGLRGVAALGVVATHVWYAAGAPRSANPVVAFVAASYLGVDMFFVISGFLLFLPYASAASLERRSYFRRRAARLVPAFYVSIIVVLTFWSFLTPSTTGVRHPLTSWSGIGDVLAHLSLLHGVILAPWPQRIGLGVNGAWWTLTLEAIFYVALPVAAARFLKHPRQWTVIVCVAAVAWRLVALQATVWGTGLTREVQNAFTFLGDGILGFAGHFAFGMLAALVVVQNRRARPALAVAGLLGAGVVAWFAGRDVIVHDGDIRIATTGYAVARPLFGAFFAVALVGLAEMRLAHRVLGAGVAKWVGDRSYGLYLFHVPIISAFAQHTGLFQPGHVARTFVSSMAVITMLSLTAGAVSYALVEQPAMRWARRRERPRDLTDDGPKQGVGDIAEVW